MRQYLIRFERDHGSKSVLVEAKSRTEAVNLLLNDMYYEEEIEACNFEVIKIDHVFGKEGWQ